MGKKTKLSPLERKRRKRASEKRWCRENKERVKEVRGRYYKNHREEIRKQQHDYYWNNRSSILSSKKASRVAKAIRKAQKMEENKKYLIEEGENALQS